MVQNRGVDLQQRLCVFTRLACQSQLLIHLVARQQASSAAERVWHALRLR